MKLLLCCSNNKTDLALRKNGTFYFCGAVFGINKGNLEKLNGKILLECDFETEKITEELYDGLEKESCLNRYDINTRLDDGEGYAIHLKNIHIFEQAKELNSYLIRKQKVVSDIICDSCNNFGFNCKKCPDSYEYFNLGRLPQNMMYCYGNLVNEKYILINTKPTELMNILNGKTTVLIRKTVLKDIKK